MRKSKSKVTIITAPTHWQKEAWYFAVDEKHVTAVAEGINLKSFDRFWARLIAVFGACSEECAAFLWNKTRPDRTPRKIYRYDTI